MDGIALGDEDTTSVIVEETFPSIVTAEATLMIEYPVVVTVFADSVDVVGISEINVVVLAG
jgi:hypothetical protein